MRGCLDCGEKGIFILLRWKKTAAHLLAADATTGAAEHVTPPEIVVPNGFSRFQRTSASGIIPYFAARPKLWRGIFLYRVNDRRPARPAAVTHLDTR